MAKFYSTGIKKLTPRPGRTYATTYHQLTDSERQRMHDHCNRIMREILEHAVTTGTETAYRDITAPMKGFPRTQKRPNYSAWDVMTDLREYLDAGKDPTEGMLGRWNRLFEEFEEVAILVEAGIRPRTQNNFGNLFQLVRKQA